MPPKKQFKSKPKAKRVYRKRVQRKRRVARNTPEYASLSVKRTLTDNGAQFNANSLFSLMNTQLIDYPRAVQVAQAYQHYRIKKIAVTFKPTLDTFAPGGMTKPRLYYMIDKSGAIPTNIALEGLKQMGARPRDLDEKNVVITWSPSVLESTMFAPVVGGSAASKYQISPWLSTVANVVSPGVFVASGIDHLGLYWYVDMLNAGGYQYAVEVEVQFQFKKPISNILSSVEAKPATIAVINNSPDGVVGGSDDHLAT